MPPLALLLIVGLCVVVKKGPPMSLSRNTLLIVQTGTPPDEIASDHGDLPSWFGHLLAPWRNKISVARVFAGETLPAPDNATVAVIINQYYC